MPKLFLIDAYALIFRSYYAFISRPMRNAEGVNTSPIFGFTKFVRDIIVRERPDYLGVAFDPKGGTFRNQMYPEYKANRSATPEDIIAAVPYIKRILDAMCIPTIEIPGFEADDVIGTLSVKASDYGFDVYMVTPDKDYGQLVSDRAVIYKQSKGDSGIEVVDRAAIKAHYGFDNPELVADILALWGDTADNVPGLPGVGEKGAIKLVGQWGDVENIIANRDKLSEKLCANIENNLDRLRLAKQLVTIDRNVPVEFEPDKLQMCAPKTTELRALFTELGFTRFTFEMDTMPSSPFRSAVCGCPAEVGAMPQPSSEVAAPAPAKPAPAPAKPAPAPATPRGDSFQASLFDEPEATATADVQGDLFSVPTMDSIASVEHHYTIVDSLDELRRLVGELLTFDEVCFDTETTGFDPFTDKFVGMSFAVRPHSAWYVPMLTDDSGERLAVLAELFVSQVTKIGQNIKFDMLFLKAAGIEVRGFKIDTMILHYLLESESRHAMNYLSRTLLNYDPIEIESLIGSGAGQRTMDTVPLTRIADYAAEDADITLQLKQLLWSRVVSEGFESLYRTIEQPLIDVLVGLELTGVKIDTEALARYAVTLNERMADIESQIRTLAGVEQVNINSPKQLGELLFERLKVDDKPRKTKTKQYSTDEEYLQMLSDRHPVIPLILEYRGVKKLLSTYVEALPKLINPVTGRIHTSFNQAVTATGRLSSTNPNLQNIPIRDELGKPIRAAFVPSDEQHVILSVDYSQIELRLMAHLSGDEALISAFQAGEDIHRATAARIFNVDLADVTDDQRRRAKTANFGIIYGISAFGLAQRLHIPRGEAKDVIDGYFRSYPGVKKYMDAIIEQARAQGYVTTIFGRRRTLSDITSRNAVARGLAERNAINAPLQGSAADVMKLAMIASAEAFARHGFKSRMILQVHDEIVVDALRSELDEVRTAVVEAMQGVARLRVQLLAEAGVGKNWLEAH